MVTYLLNSITLTTNFHVGKSVVDYSLLWERDLKIRDKNVLIKVIMKTRLTQSDLHANYHIL